MKAPIVYFYLPLNDDVYFDAPLVLAEGLRELGVPFVCNRDYWRLSPNSPETLFKRAEGFGHRDADIVVIHDDWFYHYPQSTLRIEERPAPADLFARSRRYQLVYLDTWVGARSNSWNAEFRNCDLILRTQFNGRSSHPSNMKPWALGFTKRIIAATQVATENATRRKVVVRNFAYTHPFEHEVRRIFDDQIAPLLGPGLTVDAVVSRPDPGTMTAYDRLMWQQTHDKHNPDYFAQLCSAAVVAAFCGYLCPWLPADASIHYRGEKRYQTLSRLTRMAAAFVRRPDRLIQWDSWRFWEALCAGAGALHLDLEKYGVVLPEMPQNWKHYVGIDLDALNEGAERLASNSISLSQIGQDGRAWALQHYSPRRMAERFLLELGITLDSAAA